MPEPALLRDSEPSIAPVLALFRVAPAPLSSAGVLGGHIPALLGPPHCIYPASKIKYISILLLEKRRFLCDTFFRGYNRSVCHQFQSPVPFSRSPCLSNVFFTSFLISTAAVPVVVPSFFYSSTLGRVQGIYRQYTKKMQTTNFKFQISPCFKQEWRYSSTRYETKIFATYSFSFKRLAQRMFEKCASACTQKAPNLLRCFLKRRLTNTSRRHRLADGQLSSLYPPSPSFSSFDAASVMCCSAPPAPSSTP